MNIKQKVVYFCDFCNKHYLRPDFCLKHENFCAKNPLNKHACFNCKYLTREIQEFEVEDPYCSYSKKINIFNCSKNNIGLFTRKAEIRQYLFTQCDNFQKMPNKCEDYEEN